MTTIEPSLMFPVSIPSERVTTYLYAEIDNRQHPC